MLIMLNPLLDNNASHMGSVNNANNIKSLFSKKKTSHRENVNNVNNAKSKWGLLWIEPHGIQHY